MARGKKRIDIAELLEYANTQLARKDNEATPGFKMGVACFIEKVLHMTDNYEGFRFLNFEDSAFNTNGYWSRAYFSNERTDKKLLKSTVKWT